MTALAILDRVQKELQVGLCSSEEKRAECSLCCERLRLAEDVERLAAVHRSLDLFLVELADKVIDGQVGAAAVWSKVREILARAGD